MSSAPSDRTMACRLQPRYSFKYGILHCSVLGWQHCLKIGIVSGLFARPTTVFVVRCDWGSA